MREGMAIPRQLTLFLVATQFLTRLPVPELRGFQTSWLTQSARFFPLVGVLVGLINVGTWWLARHWFPAPVAVGIMLALSLLATGAFHEDGFADTCDGFGGGTTSERALAVMKDSRVGAYGAIGITMLLGLKWTTLVALPTAAFPVLVIGAHLVSRWCAIGLIWGLRYVRENDDAKAKPLADSVSGVDWMLSGLLGIAAILPAFLLNGLLGKYAILLASAAAALAAVITAALAAAYFKRRIGGYTGDCLGAVQQLSELVFLMAALAALVPIPAPL
jgi:adenosylcobinamide-GDP ribazoletransferase